MYRSGERDGEAVYTLFIDGKNAGTDIKMKEVIQCLTEKGC